MVLVLRGVLLLDAMDGTLMSSSDTPDGIPATGSSGTSGLMPLVANGGIGGLAVGVSVALAAGEAREEDDEDAEGLL